MEFLTRCLGRDWRLYPNLPGAFVLRVTSKVLGRPDTALLLLANGRLWLDSVGTYNKVNCSLSTPCPHRPHLVHTVVPRSGVSEIVHVRSGTP